MENPLQLERIRRMGQFGQQFIIFTRAGAGTFPFQPDPCAGHVVGHGFDAGTDESVLGDVLECAVAHELRSRSHARFKRMLEQGIDAAGRKPVVHGNAGVFRRAERSGRTEHGPDFVFRGDMGPRRPAAHIRRKVHAAGGGIAAAHATLLPAAVRFRIRGSIFSPRCDCMSRNACVVASTWSSWAAAGNCVNSAMYSAAHGQWEG